MTNRHENTNEVIPALTEKFVILQLWLIAKS